MSDLTSTIGAAAATPPQAVDAGSRDRRTRVVVVGGGQNCEHDVSLASAASVADALSADRYLVERLTIGRDGTWLGADGRPLGGGVAEAVGLIAASDVVFPALHGPRGEDGTLAGLCEAIGVAYVGCGVGAGALAMDKQATKLIASSIGLATAAGVVVTSSDPDVLDGRTLPAVVKPIAAGSSFGVALVRDAAALESAITAALALDSRALVEEVVVGREVDIAVVERPSGELFVGPPLEIVLGDGALFDTEQKYDGSADFRVPASVSSTERAALETAALAMFGQLGCAGLARFDFFVTERGVVLNEVNTMPGMTAHSQIPTMFAAVGLPYASLLDVLIETALSRRARTTSAS